MAATMNSTMAPEQVELVRKSFDAIWSVRRQLADRFYHRFFELAPDAQGLFPSDMERQHLKLMDAIAAIVGALDRRELFQSIIVQSGRQHAQFGVKSAHFDAFGAALIWGLEQEFGDVALGRRFVQVKQTQARERAEEAIRFVSPALSRVSGRL